MSDEFPRLGGVPARIGLKSALLMLVIGFPLSIIALLVMTAIWKPDSTAEALIPYAIGLGAAWYVTRWLAKRWASGHRGAAIGCGGLLIIFYALIVVLAALAVEKYGTAFLVVIVMLGLIGAAVYILGNRQRPRSGS